MMHLRDLKALARRLWRSKRVRIVMTAATIGMIAGVIKLGLPLEDMLATARAEVRYVEADGKIVVVTLDDASLSAMDAADAPRSADARLIDNLFAAGAKRVFFDRTYHFAESPQEDRALIEALERHQGKVYFGAMNRDDDTSGLSADIGPHSIFEDKVEVASLLGIYHPFKLFASFPYRSRHEEGHIPSLSARMADVDLPTSAIFRPDYAIDVKTIPTARYIDVLNGQIDRLEVRDKDVLVAPTALAFNDQHEMPSQGFVPGAFFQVVAAQTLKRGLPVDLGWMPAFVVALAIVITGMGRGRSLDRYRVAGLLAVLLFVPLILDGYNIFIEVAPAGLMALIAAFRARALDRVEAASETNVMSGLPSLLSLRNAKEPPEGNLVALKIRNYSAITASFSTSVESVLASEIVRRIHISEPEAVVYHDADMFVWLSSFSNLAELTEHLEGLHSLLQNRIRIAERDIDLSFNAGVDSTLSTPIGTRIANAMQTAEQALHDEELVRHFVNAEGEAEWQVSLLTSLDRAIDQGEVWVAYQPKLDLKTMQITGAEALVRWTHPERGPISPDHFIKLAEEYHRIERITRFVANEAVRTAAGIVRLGHDFSVSINISAQLLRNPNLPAILSDALFAHDLAPERLVLEITETDRLDRGAATIGMMRQLLDAGMQLSIDDFGTGNATIEYLRVLPAVEVKIDKGFVAEIEHNREDRLLVQSIIDMSHSLGRRVVAEGVENRSVLELLRSMNCDQVQGFYVSQPVRVDELARMLRAERMNSYG